MRHSTAFRRCGLAGRPSPRRISPFMGQHTPSESSVASSSCGPLLTPRWPVSRERMAYDPGRSPPGGAPPCCHDRPARPVRARPVRPALGEGGEDAGCSQGSTREAPSSDDQRAEGRTAAAGREVSASHPRRPSQQGRGDLRRTRCSTGRALPPWSRCCSSGAAASSCGLLIRYEQRVLPDGGGIMTAPPPLQVVEGVVYGLALHAHVVT